MSISILMDMYSKKFYVQEILIDLKDFTFIVDTDGRDIVRKIVKKILEKLNKSFCPEINLISKIQVIL